MKKEMFKNLTWVEKKNENSRNNEGKISEK